MSDNELSNAEPATHAPDCQCLISHGELIRRIYYPEAQMASSKQKARDKTKTGTTSDIPGAKVVGSIPAKGSAKAAKAPTADGAPKEKKASIAGLITGMLQDGKGSKDIEAAIKAQFPGSKAAEKAPVHISFYRSRLKKAAK